MIDELDSRKTNSYQPQNVSVENQYNMLYSQQPHWPKDTQQYIPPYITPQLPQIPQMPQMMYTYVDPSYMPTAPLYYPQNPTPFVMHPQAKPYYQFQPKPKIVGQPSSFIEEFKVKMNAPKVSSTEYKGHVYELSKDHNGSKFIQMKIEAGDEEDKQTIIKEIVECPPDIIKDVFGNYVVQKILEFSGADVQKKIMNKMKGQVKVLSLDPYGCRVLQKAIELFTSEDQITLCLELDGFVKQCVIDQNGNHVIQKCVEKMQIQNIDFIINFFNDNIIEMSKHNYGCRVIQRLLEKGQHYPAIRDMVGKLIKNVEDLAMDAFGNYVIQHVIEHGSADDITAVNLSVRKNMLMMSKQKFSSNVIEKVLQHGAESQRRDLIKATFKDENGICIIGEMMKDKFANYVVQKCIEYCDAPLLKELQGKMTKVTDQNQYCYHVQNALNKKMDSLKKL